MTFTIEKLEGEPIIVCTMSAQFNPNTDYGAFWQQLGALLEGMEAPIFRITVLEAEEITFSDMAMALAAEARSGAPGSGSDERIRLVLVSKAVLAQMAVESIRQEQYGGLDTPLFGTLEEALAYARAELKKEAES